jgi:hypothetical protein
LMENVFTKATDMHLNSRFMVMHEDLPKLVLQELLWNHYGQGLPHPV